MSEKKYYCFCSSNCKYETMTKEQIMAAIAQATGSANVDPDAGFISKVKEANGRYVTFWVGTQAEYNALQDREENCLHIITDDTTKADMEKVITQYANQLDTATTAAAVATKAAEEAKETAAGMQPVNILSAVGDFSWLASGGGRNCTELILSKAKFEFVPALKMVHYIVGLQYVGTLTENEEIVFQCHNGKYKRVSYPYSNAATCATTSGKGQFEARYQGSNELVIRATKAVTSTEMSYVIIDGWYECNGEG